MRSPAMYIQKNTPRASTPTMHSTPAAAEASSARETYSAWVKSGVVTTTRCTPLSPTILGLYRGLPIGREAGPEDSVEAARSAAAP